LIGKKIYRTDHIHDFAQELRKSKEELARTMTKEMARPIKDARSEIVYGVFVSIIKQPTFNVG